MGQTLRKRSVGPGAAHSGPDEGPDEGRGEGRGEGPGVVARCHGIEVPVGPHLTVERVLALRDGSYAVSLLYGALSAIVAADRVLVLGAAEGVVPAVIARNCQPVEILAFDRDAALLAQAAALCRHNGLEDRVTLRHGQVVAEPDAPDGPDLSCALDPIVPVARYDRLRRTGLHNVLVMDLAGAELAFLRHASLSGVRLVLVALHPEVYGRAGVRDCRRALTRAGYERDLGLSRSGARSGSGAAVDVFRRVRA